MSFLTTRALATAGASAATPVRLPGALDQLAPGLGRHPTLITNHRDGPDLPAGLAHPWPRPPGAAAHRCRTRDPMRRAPAACVAAGRDAIRPRQLHLPQRTVHRVHRSRGATRGPVDPPKVTAATALPQCRQPPGALCPVPLQELQPKSVHARFIHSMARKHRYYVLTRTTSVPMLCGLI